MMSNLSNPSTLTVPLSVSAHQLAQQFCQQQSEPVKQIYLNTLAIAAVEFYLSCMGIETNWKASQSYHPVMRSMLDVADLEIVNYGKLECRPVLPEAETVYIPPETCGDRIGYVAVQFDDLLQEATLLGFISTSHGGEISIEQLQPLDSLLEYLASVQSAQLSSPRIKLGEWFENWVDQGWKSLEDLMGHRQLNPAFSLRNDALLNEATVQRGKLIDLGVELGNFPVMLLMTIVPRDTVPRDTVPRATGAETDESEQPVEVQVQVHPAKENAFLPADLNLSLLSEEGKILQTVRSRNHDNYVQLKRFRGVPGECFDIQLAFGDIRVTEAFMI